MKKANPVGGLEKTPVFSNSLEHTDFTKLQKQIDNDVSKLAVLLRFDNISYER